ncbi:MAG: 50S ribosomal protein L35ae [Nanoarchaeota archaeon]|nr:50S ribosomal protein L35ae [Nanoarchaeota archaeon]
MKGRINNFRQGRHHQKTTHVLVSVDDVDNKEKAVKLIGKKAVWKSPKGKEINGIIKSIHGNSGVIRIIFEKGLPGQAITSKIEIK